MFVFMCYINTHTRCYEQGQNVACSQAAVPGSETTPAAAGLLYQQRILVQKKIEGPEVI
jgi:hypothetical protein